MSEILEIDGVDLRGHAFGCATRTGRYSLPARRGENLILTGASGSRFVANKPFEEGLGALSVWCIGARTGDVVTSTNLARFPRGAGGAVPNNSSYWTVEYNVAVSGHPLGITTAVKGTLTGDPRPQVISLYNGDGLSATETIRGVGAWFMTSEPNCAGRIRVGASIGAQPLPPNEWVWVESPTIFSGHFTLEISKTDGSNAPAGAVGYVTGIIATEGRIPQGFWDGDSAVPEPYKVRWTGTPLSSSSERYLSNQMVIPDTFSGQRQAFEENMARALRLFTRPHRLSEIRAAQPDGSIRRALVEWREWSEPEVMAGGTRAEWAMGYSIPGVWWEDEAATTQAATAGAALPKTLDLTSFTGMTGIIEDAVIEVVGPITNPRVTDEETGAYVEYLGTVAAGSTWTVDVKAATSKVGGASVMANTRHAGHYKLFVIPNCYGLTDIPRLTLSGTSGDTTTNLSVTARRKWATG